MRYTFYVHKQLPAWRLVVLEGAPVPAGCVIADWSPSRVREHDDTHPDVRQQIAEQGFALFKLGGDFADVARELGALGSASAEGRLGAARASALERFPVHLGLGASAQPQPQYTGELEWYESYAARTAADGVEGRLVSLFSFDRPWDSWEVHPHGSELVLCTAGEVTLVQELEGEPFRIPLRAGEYAINPPGIWHTADVERQATALFITAGTGTQHRPRALNG